MSFCASSPVPAAPPRYAAEQIDFAGVTTAVGDTSWPLTDLEKRASDTDNNASGGRASQPH
jgi:hypothetical protein